MNFLSIEEILGYLEITSIQNIPEELIITGISTDSRSIRNGEIFVALKGENFDGHNFVREAHHKGASIAIVSKDWAEANSSYEFPIISVKDTLFALGELANLYRSKFEIPIVAVAGSNGKTTTKDFIAHILSQKYKVLKTESNLNNQIGVPLTLLKLNPTHEVAVIEIGTNQFGEIQRLCEIVEPTHGLITNIGKEHLEAFIDLDGVEMEETTLFGYLLKHDGLSFINLDDPRLKKYTQLLEKQFTYGQSEESQLRFSFQMNESLLPIVSFEYDSAKFSVQLNNLGYSVALASVAAVAVGFAFDLAQEEIIEGLTSFHLPEYKDYGRMLVKSIGNITIINDTYNANPSSMNLALETLDKINTEGKKIAVLGDMLELGDASLQEHREIIQKASKISDLVFIFGAEMKKAYEQSANLHNVCYFDEKFEIPDALINKLVGKDVILFKASRGMRCEEILMNFVNKISK